MDVQLELIRHCIETELRLQHDRLVRDYFKEKDPSVRNDLETKLEMVVNALSSFDFGRLRTEIPELCAGEGHRAVLAGSPEAVWLSLPDGREIMPLE